MNLLQEYKAHSDPERTVLYGALCPACGFEHGFRVDAEYWAREGQDVWQFDGNMESPTFEGSMLSNDGGAVKNKPVCHSHVKAGVWEFLDDCTHEMAGKQVPMVDYPADYWEARTRKVQAQNEDKP